MPSPARTAFQALRTLRRPLATLAAMFVLATVLMSATAQAAGWHAVCAGLSVERAGDETPEPCPWCIDHQTLPPVEPPAAPARTVAYAPLVRPAPARPPAGARDLALARPRAPPSVA